jgi:fatty-acyl-CoA synthase
LGGNTVRIIEPTTGEVLPIGQTGEIVVKGPTLFKGYLKVPLEDTVDGDGFFHTADAGYIMENGHLYWKGRLSDIIKTGGANVSPQEVDAVIAKHPDLQAVFTVGIPDVSLGELVVSCVIARAGTTPDEASVQTFAKQTLASYKVPRRVLFFTDAELPMTGSNKIQRGQLKELVQKRLAG